MKRKNVKFYIGNKPCSVWRITFVNRFSKITSCINQADGHVYDFYPDGDDAPADCYLTYFVFGVDYPSALKKLSFVPKDTYEVLTFERFNTADYNLIYEL